MHPRLHMAKIGMPPIAIPVDPAVDHVAVPIPTQIKPKPNRAGRAISNVRAADRRGTVDNLRIILRNINYIRLCGQNYYRTNFGDYLLLGSAGQRLPGLRPVSRSHGWNP